MLPLLVGRKLDSSTDSFQTLTDRLNANTSRRSIRSCVIRGHGRGRNIVRNA